VKSYPTRRADTYLNRSADVNLSRDAIPAAAADGFVDVTESDTKQGDPEWTFTTSDGKNVTVKANQSVATINGKVIDLNGQVALFINGHFYVPSMLLDKIDF